MLNLTDIIQIHSDQEIIEPILNSNISLFQILIRRYNPYCVGLPEAIITVLEMKTSSEKKLMTLASIFTYVGKKSVSGRQ